MKLAFWVIITSWTVLVNAQECDCDIEIANLQAATLNIINASDYSYKPGDKICIQGGNYAGLRFVGFNGSEENPLVITNCNGAVVITENNYSGISFKYSKYIKLLGSGDINEKYGIRVESANNYGANGIDLSFFTSDVEIAFVELRNTGFAGILGKTDPDCSDEGTWRRNGFVLQNLNIHDNYIHDTGGEGIYLGYTGGYKVESSKFCNDEYVFGHWLENVAVHHNRFERTGWDGIQLNLVRQGGLVYDNLLIDCGVKDVLYQNYMMSLGGGSYEVYNNKMYNTSTGLGQGIQFISVESGSKIYNNLIVKPMANGIFIHNRHEFGDISDGYYIMNNTIISPEDSGILYNTLITKSFDENIIGDNQENVRSLFANNLILNPGNAYELDNTWKGESENYIDFNDSATKLAQQNNFESNIFSNNLNDLCLFAPSEDDYRPASEYSPLVDTGFDVSDYGISTDLLGGSRSFGAGYDIGAYEFQDDIGYFDCLKASLNGVMENCDSVIVLSKSQDVYQFGNECAETCELVVLSEVGEEVLRNRYHYGRDIDLSDLKTGRYRIKFGNSSFTKSYEIYIK